MLIRSKYVTSMNASMCCQFHESSEKPPSVRFCFSKDVKDDCHRRAGSVRAVPLPTVAQQITAPTKPQPGQRWSSVEALSPTSGLLNVKGGAEIQPVDPERLGPAKRAKTSFSASHTVHGRLREAPCQQMQGRGPIPGNSGQGILQGRQNAPAVALPVARCPLRRRSPRTRSPATIHRLSTLTVSRSTTVQGHRRRSRLYVM